MFAKFLQILAPHYLFLLIILSTLFSWTFLVHPYIPSHDSLHNFDLFYFFYNEFFYTGKIAQWMPFYSYGLPASYWQLYAISPAGYLCMFVGGLLKITNVLFLFYLSFLIEHLIFLFGMYLLSLQLFTLSSTRFFVCLAACSLHSILAQACFGLQIFYILPLILSCIVQFFSLKNPLFFWLAGICVIFGTIGNTIYFAFIWIFIASIIFIGLSLKGRSTLKSLLTLKTNNILPALLFFLFAISLYITLSSITHFAQMPFRVGGKASNSLGMFLTYGDNFDLKKLLTWFIFGQNWNIYLGILPLIFLIYALIKERSRPFLIFSSASVAVLCLTFGGLFAGLIYYFPGMSLYRHIGMSYDLLKPLLLICAGFGWEHFFKNQTYSKYWILFASPLILIFLCDSQGISLDWLSQVSNNKALLKGLISNFDFASPIFRIGITILGILIVAIFTFNKRKNVQLMSKIILLAVLALDVFSFEYSIYQASQTYRLSSDSTYANLFSVAPIQYQEQRLPRPTQSRAIQAWDFKHGDEFGAITYASAYSFIGFEPCINKARQDFIPLRTAQLGPIQKIPDGDIIFGCSAPKLRLVKNTNLEQSSIGQVIRVDHFNSDSLNINVTINDANGAWLTYADSYHPGWKASIDQKSTVIYPSHTAFKEVLLPQGNHQVRFYFDNGFVTFCSYALAIISLALILAFGFFLL